MTALAVLLRPDSPIWKWLLWGGVVVFVACAVVFLAGIIKPGGRVFPLIGIGVGILIFGGCGIAYFFERPSLPYNLNLQAFIPGVDYPPGRLVHGIMWKSGYSHLQLVVTNPTEEIYTDVDLVIAPEKPIIRATVRSEFASCRIGLDGAPPIAPLAVGTSISGKVFGMPVEDSDLNVTLGPPYRLVCDKIPGGAQIVLEIATVQPTGDPMSENMWSQERRDPMFVDIHSSFVVNGKKYTDDSRLSFAAGESPQ